MHGTNISNLQIKTQKVMEVTENVQMLPQHIISDSDINAVIFYVYS